MRTLTAPATLATGRANTEPVLLVTLTTVSGAIFRFSDYNRVVGGVEYLGLIQNPEDFAESLNDFDGGGAPATASLVLFNDRPVGGKSRFSDLISTPRNTSGTYDFRNARVDIDRLEYGQALADAIRLQSFYLETPSEIGDQLITLQMSDLAQKLEDALPIATIDRSVFPTAPPSSLGQPIRRPFGVLKNVKAIPVQDGAASTLDGDITDVATTIALLDATLFPASGTALIDAEFITWTGKSGATLINVVRGALSTTAIAHSSGASVLQARTDQYVFVVGEGVTRPLDYAASIMPNGRFTTDVSSWSGSGTWDSGNGGQAKLLKVGLQNLLQTLTVGAGTTHRMRFTIRTSSIRLFVSDAPAGGGNVLYDVTNVAGSYEITLVSATTTMYINFVNGNVADAFLDDVTLEPLGTSLAISAITNIRVNGRPAKTSPTATPADATLAPNRLIGTIRFTPGNVALFHTLSQGLPEVFSPAALSVTGDGATNISVDRVITPTANVAEVGRRTRRTISWTVTTTTAFTDANHWGLARYLTAKGNATAVTIGGNSGVAGNTTGFTWSGSDTREYDGDGSETISFASLLGSAKIITCAFTEATVTYLDTGGGGDSTAGAAIGEVVCDVQGMQDDAGGTISGTPSLLLENPIDVMRAIMTMLYGVPASTLNATWATTRSIMASASYRWATLLDMHQFSALRRAFSEQARARVVMTSGAMGVRFRSYRPTADVLFQYDPATGRTGLAQGPTIKLTSPTELITGLTARYAYDDAKGDYQKTVVFGDPIAAAAGSPMELEFIADDATARDIAAYWFGLRGRARFALDGTAWHNALILEQGDHFAVKGHPALLAHGDDALIFALLRKTDRGGRDGIGQIALGGIEDTVEGDVGAEDTSMSWGSRGLLAKNNSSTPNTKFDVAAASVTLRNSSNQIVIRHNPSPLTCDVGVAGPAANGRDQVGAFSASSWVHFYYAWDSTNGILATLASAVAPPTGPSLPTNFTHWAYIGAVYFNGSSQLVRTVIAGCRAQRATVEMLAAAVTDNVEHSLDGSAVWPPNALGIFGTWGAILNVAGDSADLRAESGVDAGPHLETPGATTTGFGGGFLMNVTGQTVWYIQSANASRVWRVEVCGYILPNGGEG